MRKMLSLSLGLFLGGMAFEYRNKAMDMLCSQQS